MDVTRDCLALSFTSFKVSPPRIELEKLSPNSTQYGGPFLDTLDQPHLLDPSDAQRNLAASLSMNQ